MLANYHTHTARCGHAVGTDRAYVETAIARGLRTLGFSDHVPMPFSDGHESRFRVPLRLLDDYVKSVLSLKQEYAPVRMPARQRSTYHTRDVSSACGLVL